MLRTEHLILFLFLLISCADKQPVPDLNAKEAAFKAPDPQLFDTIRTQDSILFTAFNKRDLSGMANLLDSTLELFQDNIGVRDYRQSLDAFGEVFKKEYVLTRTLVPGSLEVYPIREYGAIESGRHTFCHMENGQEICATFKFVHIWQRKNGGWKITRIVTYDHPEK